MRLQRVRKSVHVFTADNSPDDLSAFPQALTAALASETRFVRQRTQDTPEPATETDALSARAGEENSSTTPKSVRFSSTNPPSRSSSSGSLLRHRRYSHAVSPEGSEAKRELEQGGTH